MIDNFFEQDVKVQTDSLTKFAHEILKKYGISDAEVECINFEFNATFSVSTVSGQKVRTAFEHQFDTSGFKYSGGDAVGERTFADSLHQRSYTNRFASRHVSSVSTTR
jgi:hypothetical protein